MLEAVGKAGFGLRFEVREDGVPVSELALGIFREKAEFQLGGERLELRCEGFWRGEYLLRAGGRTLARAERIGFFRPALEFRHGDRTYRLTRRSPFRPRVLALLAGGREVGTLSRQGRARRGVRAELPAELPLAVRVFLIWVAVLIWKRARQA